MTKIKVCGITKTEDAILAAKLGAWAIGFIFYPKSPRYITPENAQKIADSVKNYGTKTVGVFVNEKAENMNKIAEIVGLDFVQLHGFEDASECAKLNLPYIKNIRNTDEMNIYSDAFAFLVDAPDSQNWGGTGKLADWNLAKEIKRQNKPLVLSGGLTLDNLEKALKEIMPDYIDISSGLEISPGIKNHEKMKEFFETKGALINE